MIDDVADNNTCCSCRDPDTSSGYTQLPVTPVPGDAMLTSGLHDTNVHVFRYACMSAHVLSLTHTNKHT